MATTLKHSVKSTNAKAPHSASRSTPEMTEPPPSTLKDADQSIKELAEVKDEDAFCVPWYLPWPAREKS